MKKLFVNLQKIKLDYFISIVGDNIAISPKILRKGHNGITRT